MLRKKPIHRQGDRRGCKAPPGYTSFTVEWGGTVIAVAADKPAMQYNFETCEWKELVYAGQPENNS